MKRVAHHPQRLKHLPFFEVLSSVPEESSEARLATAGLLTLRMIDHWVLAGSAIVEPESVSVRSVRRAITAVPPQEPIREALLTIVNTMQMLREVDVAPLLPRVFAYAQLLERHHAAMALAADAYQSVIRLADAEFDAELVMDAYYRLAFCQRKVGALDDAVESSTALSRIAGRRKDRARVLRAKIGLGLVAMMRGDLADADSMFVAVATEGERYKLTREFAMATHNRAVVASRAGNATDAVILAHQALKSTNDPVERDRVLGDLAAFLIQLEQYDVALDALRILELTAASEEPRLSARGNILIVAARAGNKQLFDAAQASLAEARLPVAAHVNFLVESARGLFRFGDQAAADLALTTAEREAKLHGLTGSLTEIDGIRRTGERPVVASADVRTYVDNRTYTVAADLREMAAAIAA
ncbi:MAG: hypothetical protein O2973_11605 [Gemmatimonadetes bacterium]|nr:hypothetical protein [Gemmatimonadota bacterium]